MVTLLEPYEILVWVSGNEIAVSRDSPDDVIKMVEAGWTKMCDLQELKYRISEALDDEGSAKLQDVLSFYRLTTEKEKR